MVRVAVPTCAIFRVTGGTKLAANKEQEDQRRTIMNSETSDEYAITEAR